MGFPGSGVVVHHADIEADSREEALEKARSGKALWRCQSMPSIAILQLFCLLIVTMQYAIIHCISA